MNQKIIERKINDLGGVQAVLGGPTIPMSENQLVDLENLIGISLPKDYREFVKQYGACKFSALILFKPIVGLPNEISSSGNGCFDFFFGADNDEALYSLKWAFSIYKNRMPSSLIPIGGNLAGGVLCIGLSEDLRGKVFYWDPSNEWDEDDLEDDDDIEKLVFQNVYTVANDFLSFITSLEELPDV